MDSLESLKDQLVHLSPAPIEVISSPARQELTLEGIALEQASVTVADPTGDILWVCDCGCGQPLCTAH